MEPTPYELTPEQKALLQSLARQTDKDVPSLIAKALQDLQEHVRLDHVNGDANGSGEEERAGQLPETHKPIWEKFIEASHAIPDHELDCLPTDFAAQVDHYIYGTPKRPV